MSTWSEIVEPLVARFEIAATFGQQAVWNAKGSEAMATLLKEMASRLDIAVEMKLAEQPPASLSSPRQGGE